MPRLIEDILYDTFCEIGKISSKSHKSRTALKDSELVKFMVIGRIPMKIAFDFFKSSKSAVLSDKCIEIFNDIGKSAAFGNEICQIPSIANILQHRITKLRCKTFNPKFLPFWELVKDNIIELDLGDVFFCNQKLMEILRNFTKLEKATISLGIYSLTFIEEVLLRCPELVLKTMPFDQIENEKFENTRQSNVKDLTVEGHYATNGLQTMSLKRLIRKINIAFPNLEKLKIVIEDETIENEDAKDIIDLIENTVIEQNFDLTVIFNFAVTQNFWKDSYFHKSLTSIPRIKFTDSEYHSKSELQISDKILLQINLSSQIDNDFSDHETFLPKRRRKCKRKNNKMKYKLIFYYFLKLKKK